MASPEWVTMRHPTGRVEQRHASVVDYWTQHGWELVAEHDADPSAAETETPATEAAEPTSTPPRQARQKKEN